MLTHVKHCWLPVLPTVLADPLRLLFSRVGGCVASRDSIDCRGEAGAPNELSLGRPILFDVDEDTWVDSDPE